MNEQGLDKGKEVAIAFQVAGDIVSRYATNIVIQHTKHEFIVSFFEVEPPVMLGSPEERRDRLNRLSEVRAKCVGRIIVAPGRMQAFIDVMQESLSKYLASKEQGQ